MGGSKTGPLRLAPLRSGQAPPVRLRRPGEPSRRAHEVLEMSYCLKADILTEISEEELIGLTDDESAGIINDDRVTAAVAKADGIIDSYCGQVESVPFVVVPAVIKQHSMTLAIYFLFARRSAVPEIRRKNYEDAIGHLKDISTGKAALPPIAEADVTGEVQTDRTEEDRTFTIKKTSDGSSGSLDNY